MINYLRILFIIGILFLNNPCNYAHNITFKHLTIKEELSHYSVMALYQDERGIIWMGTRNGVSAYDGNEMTIFRHDENNPHSIQSNLIKDIVGDKNGHIYFLTIRGISRYDIQKEHFTDLASGNINAIYYHDNNLYIGNGNEIGTWENNQIKPIYKLPSANDIISCLYIHNDDIYIGTEENGMYVWSDKEKILKHIIPQGRISKIVQDGKGCLWIGTWNNGLYVLSEGNIKNYRHHTDDKHSLCADFVRTFCEDQQGNMWIGTFRGLSKYQPESDSFINYQEQSNTPTGMTHASIWSMICDHQGTLWFGTYFGGINYFNPRQNIIQYHLPQEMGINESVIGAMTEDEDNNLWICSEGNGLYKLNRTNGNIHHYKHSEKRNSISHNNLKSILYDSKRNVLWIGTHLGGLNKLDLRTGKFTHYSYNKDKNISHKSDIICDIVLHKDNLYLGTHDGVYQFNIFKEEFTPLFKDGNYEKTVNFALDLQLNGDSLLWIAGAKEGAFVYHFNNDKLELHNHSKETGSISNNGINCLYEDSKHRIWLGTAENGIDCYNKDKHTFENFNETDNKLLSNCIYGMCEISPDKFIILTDNGFCYFDSNLKSSRNFKANSNLPLTAINQKSIYQTSDGELFIGGVDGMISFHPEDLNFERLNYRIFPYKLFVNDQEIKVNDHTGILNQSLSLTNEITLNDTQTMISIIYATTNYNSLDKEEIVYRLENFSDEWTTLRNGRMITYTNLTPGEYTLLIKPLNDTDIYSKLKINILPPWYKTTYAYIGYILIVLLLLYIINYSYKHRVRLQTALEFERKRIKDIEKLNQYKLRFFTNISHEFRTPLTLITSQTELLLQIKTFVPAVYNRLLNVYKSSMQLQSLISELLDFRKQEQGHMKIRVTENNLVDFMHENFLLFKEYANDKQIELCFHASEKNILVWFDIKQMQKVINNLLSNALKYTPQGGKIELSVLKVEDKAIIMVKDNGYGIPEYEIKDIFMRFYQTEHALNSSDRGIGIGLALSKGIVELHHGTIDVESKINEGSTFTIELPLGKDHMKQEEIAKEKQIFTTNSNDVYKELTPIEIDDLKINEKDDKTHQILIVEDDNSLRNLLIDVFSPYYTIISATNGEEAIRTMEENMPDIIVTDVLMPGMSGIELCKRIKGDIDTCHIPVVLLTARTALEHKLEGLNTGADDYITKPFEINILLARCRNLINNRIVLQEKFSNQLQTSPQIFATNPLDKEFMDKVTQVIDKHIDNPKFNVNLFAQEMCIARTKLFTKLRGITGKTPNELILAIRLKKAANYLINQPEMSITEISEKTGFNSQRYFSKCFKSAYSISPQAYRKGDKRDLTDL